MSQKLSWIAALCAVVVVGACANTAPVEEQYVVLEEPVTAEPVYTGKY